MAEPLQRLFSQIRRPRPFRRAQYQPLDAFGGGTLTDAEREAVAIFAATEWSGLRWSEVEKHAITLSGLLERMGGGK